LQHDVEDHFGVAEDGLPDGEDWYAAVVDPDRLKIFARDELGYVNAFEGYAGEFQEESGLLREGGEF
jgi:hypothetical protein